MAFDPVADGSYLFTTATAWGRAEISGDRLAVHVIGGHLRLRRLELRGRAVAGPLDIPAGASYDGSITVSDPSPLETS